MNPLTGDVASSGIAEMGLDSPNQPDKQEVMLSSSSRALIEIDKRRVVSAEWLASREAAAQALGKNVPGAKVDFDSVSGGAKSVVALGSFLAGPTNGDAADAVKLFINEHQPLFGHSAAALEKGRSRLTRDDTTAGSGLRTLVYQQELDGIPLFNTILKANLGKQGELAAIGSDYLRDPEMATGLPKEQRTDLIANPSIDAKNAISLAAASISDSVPAAQVAATGEEDGPERRQRFTGPGITDTFAQMTWMPLSADELKLAWDVTIFSLSRNEMFRAVVDASSGEVLYRTSLTSDISNASYRVFGNASTFKPNDSPTEMSPGFSSPTTTQPPLLTRNLVTLQAVNVTASPNGWINDGNQETLGNNVDAHTDTDANNVADTPRPNGGAGRTFDFALDLTQAPSTYKDAAVTQLFYYCNWMHDQLYSLGWTESSGNMQTDNFGRGGVANDALQADAQDGSGSNNANMSTPADGSPGRLQMFLWTGPTPDRDGDFDGEVVCHEYCHGLSNRLVGGGVGISANQSAAMGEGWSDWYPLALFGDASDDLVNGTWARGGYSRYQISGSTTFENYYYGGRRYPYGTDMSKNPLTFKDIDPTQADPHTGILRNPFVGTQADEVHNAGEVWCVTLWEVRKKLIDKHGFAIGNQLVLRLVTDGMKLSPANPNFLQARDAIIQADLVANGGANKKELWAGFAKRGMGSHASSPASSTHIGIVENFDVPDDLDVTPATSLSSAGTETLGPFSPSSTVYTLTNNGVASVNWTAAKTQSWLDLSGSSGTLPVAGTANVTASINSGALALAAGTYTDTITFTNTGNGATFTRPVSLVINPLIVAANFTSNSTVPVTASSFSATGRTVNITLSYAPTAGTILTLVNNTGAAPIGGAFTNLPNQSIVVLTFNSVSYSFYLSYTGGTGNDITLSLIPVAQSIAFDAIPPKLTTASPFGLTASATSGLPVGLAVVSGPASLSGNMVTLTGAAGAVTIKATQAGNSTFAAATDVYRSFVVTTTPFQFAKVYAGSFSTFALKADGTMWSWGAVNGTGSLGDATTTGRPTPTQIGTATNWTTLAIGNSHGLGLRSDGTMWAWGFNSNGQIGDGTLVSRTAPTQIGIGFTWTAIAAGQSFSAAVRSDGTLWTWGLNANGQLGINSTTQSLTLVQVGTDTNWRAVSCGAFHTTALKSNGEVWSCGLNSSGQLGDGTTTQSLILVRTGSASDWDSIDTGFSFTLGRKTDGTLWGWGAGTSGQMGDGGFSNRTSPGQIGTDTDWVGLEANNSTAGARKSDGTLWVWGSNSSGLMADGLTGVARTTPGKLNARTDWAGLAIGASFLCALDSAGVAWTAGESSGFTGTSPRSLALAGTGASAFTSISGTGSAFIGLRSDGTLWGWGANSFSTIGDGSSQDKYVLTQVGVATDWKQVSVGNNSTSSNNSSMAVKTTGTLWGWGYNISNNLGDGTTTTRSSPTQIGTATDWKQVSVGSSHSMAVKTDGTLWGWGSNSSSQLGDGTTTAKTTPGQIGVDTTWKSVSCGGTHTLAVRTDGTLWGWGFNSSGQVGDNTTTTKTTPVQIGTATDWAEVAGGSAHSVALKTTGTLWTWGNGFNGQQGSGSTANRLVPTQVGSATNWAKIAAGSSTTAAITTTGTLWVCGQNQYGQNGFGNVTQMNTLTQVCNDTNFAGVAMGATTIAAVRSDGTFWTAGTGFGPRAMAGARDPRLLSPVLPALTAQTINAPSASYNTWQSPVVFTATSGLKPTVKVISGPATASGDSVTLTGAGTVVVSAWQFGDEGAWNAVPPTQFTFSSSNTLTATFPSAGSTGTTANGFNAGSVALSLTLGFAPSVGQSVTLVNNTSANPVIGTFAGVPNGGYINLTFGGTIYPFQINYAGGDGNDITLTAASNVPQTIAVTDINPKETTDAPFAVNATSSSGLPITFSIVTGPASVTGNTITLTGVAGSVTVKASQAGNAFFLPAEGLITFAVGTGIKFSFVASGSTSSTGFGIKTNGTLWAWGANNGGNLGDGSSTYARFTPVQVGVATNWQGVSSSNFTIGWRTDGSVYGWGLNTAGQFGNGTTTQTSTPTLVAAYANTRMISAGTSFTVAVKNDGTLWASGTNTSGQLGNGTTTSQTTATQMGTATNWSSVSAGSSHVIAVKTDGTLWSWGLNSAGQLGDGTTTNHSSPAQVGTDTNWQSVSAGNLFSMAVKTNGTLWGWGTNTSGQLGDGTVVNKLSPVQIGSATNWKSVAASNFHTVAVRTDGSVWAWGSNTNGQLGSGNFSSLLAPARIGVESDYSAVSAGSSHSLALKTDGTIWTWGDSLGYSGLRPRALSLASTDTGWAQVSSGLDHGLGRKTDGTLWAWGGGSTGQIGNNNIGDQPAPVQIGTLTNWAFVRASNGFSHAIKTDGTLWGWGSNTLSMLGDGTASQRAAPVQIGSATTWSRVAGGVFHAIGLRTDGTLWAWGLNFQGQLGDGTTTNKSSPVQVGTATDWQSIGTGGRSSYAIKTNGTLWAWGNNTFGQLGDGTSTQRNSPVQIGAATNWKAVSGGIEYTSGFTDNSFTIGLRTDGTLWAWGINTEGQLGDGTTTQRNSPVQIGTDTNWASIATGTQHTVAIKTDGSLWAWGGNAIGQHGDGSTTGKLTPARIGSHSGWGTVAAGSVHSFFTNADGTLWTAGSSGNGRQINAGRSRLRPAPLATSLNTQSINLTPTGTNPFRFTSTSGLPVSLSLISGSAIISGDQITLTGASGSSVVMQIWQPGDERAWNAAGPVQVALTKIDPPTVVSASHSNLTGTSASLSASVNPNAGATSVLFRYGTDPTLASFTPTSSQNIGSGTSPVSTTPVTINSLTSGAVYYYRAVATNSAGTSLGPVLSFLSLPREIVVEHPLGTGLVSGTSTVTWGNVPQGIASPKTFTIRNTGGDALGITSVSIVGGNSGDFAVNTTGMSSSVQPSGSTTFVVTFTPAALSARGTTLRILNSDADEGTFDIALTGSGIVQTTNPVNSALGDAVTGAAAPNASGASDGNSFSVLKRGAFLAENGTLVFPGSLSGPGVDASNFQGIWKDDGGGLLRIMRSGEAAPETSGALFNILPDVPGINDNGDVTVLAALRIGTGGTAVTSSDDLGIWSQLASSSLRLLARESDLVSGSGLPANTRIDAFESGCFATARLGATQGEAAFTVTFKGGTTDSALLRTSISGPVTTVVSVVARENQAAGATGENFGMLNGDYTGSVRMDAQGGIVFGAVLRPSGRTSVWYQPQTGGAPVLAIKQGDNAPNTTAKFSLIDLPSMGGNGTFAFRGMLTVEGDNSSNTRNDGIWRGSIAGGLTCILRRGDDNANRAGLFPTAAVTAHPQIKAGNIYSGWLTNNNRGAWLGWVDFAGDGISSFPADGVGIYTDIGGAPMNLVISTGDAAPGVAGATMFYMDHPVVSGDSQAEHLAFIGFVTGGGTTAGANDKGVWRMASGGALNLVLRTGTSISTTEGLKTIADLDLPGSGYADHLWETPVMDQSGRLVINVTFMDGSTTQIIAP